MNKYYYDDTNQRSSASAARRRRAAEKKRKRRLKRRIFALIIAALFIFLGYIRFMEPYMLNTSRIEYTEPRLSFAQTGGTSAESSEQLKIALFADTHFSEYYTPENFRDVIERINSENPDIVFFLGDLVDDYSNYDGSLDDIQDGLSQINARIGKYAVYGNHDYGGDMQFRYPEVMEAGGFQLLVNETADLPQFNIRILGIDDMLIGFGDPSIARNLPDDMCNIVICHEPDVFDEMQDCSIDLMFSGHTHGRQINIALFNDFIQPPYGKKYIKGSYDLDNERETSLYVTSGIGMTKLPFRFGAFPEINIVTVSS